MNSLCLIYYNSSKRQRWNRKCTVTTKPLNNADFPSPGNRFFQIRLHSQCTRTVLWRKFLTPSILEFSLLIFKYITIQLQRILPIFSLKRLVWLRELGLLEHWAESFLPRPYICSAPLSSLRRRKNEKLTINYLSSAFLLYCVGVAISLFTFVIEVVYANLRKHLSIKVL